jgi:hypothetical protein
MDDMVVVAKSKNEAVAYREKISHFLMEHLRLDLNAKTSVRPLGRVEFVGYMVSAKKLTIRKQTVRRIKGAYHGICRTYLKGGMTKAEFDRRTASYAGMVSHVDSRKLKRRLNEIYLLEKQKQGITRRQQEGDKGSMPTTETIAALIERQSIIISEQSRTINELFGLLAQHLTAEELDSLPQVKRINTLAGLMD